jgi:hypothetical protein
MGACFARPGHAQSVAAPETPVQPVRLDLDPSFVDPALPGITPGAIERLRVRGESYRTTGQVLTVVGSLSFIATVVLWNLALSSHGDDSGRLVMNGFFTMFGAGAGLGAGIPLWLRGNRLIDQADSMSERTAVLPYVAPVSGGVVAGVSAFRF